MTSLYLSDESTISLHIKISICIWPHRTTPFSSRTCCVVNHHCLPTAKLDSLSVAYFLDSSWIVSLFLSETTSGFQAVLRVRNILHHPDVKCEPFCPPSNLSRQRCKTHNQFQRNCFENSKVCAPGQYYIPAIVAFINLVSNLMKTTTLPNSSLSLHLLSSSSLRACNTKIGFLEKQPHSFSNFHLLFLRLLYYSQSYDHVLLEPDKLYYFAKFVSSFDCTITSLSFFHMIWVLTHFLPCNLHIPFLSQ